MSIESAVILAAGEGQRLRPLTKHRPKPMLPAATSPILEYVFDALIDAGVDDLHVVVGYQRSRVQEHFGPTYRDRTITYHIQEKQLGSGHALMQAREAVTGDFLVVNGDEIVSTDTVTAVLEAHSAADVCTLAVVESTAAPLYGAVRLDGETVTELTEKPGSGAYRLLNIGVYAFGPSFFSTVEQLDREDGELGLTDSITAVLDRGGHVRGIKAGGLPSEVTYPWDLPALAQTLLVDGQVSEPARDPGVYVADAAQVAESATLHAPVVIGTDAVVEPGAIVGPNTAVGHSVTVEAGAVVRDSVLDTDTHVHANATLIDTVTGRNVEVGAGAAAPGGPADVRVDTTVHKSERLGCVLADRTRLGGGATVTPGLLVGPGATIAPGVTLHQNIKEDAEVQG